MKFCPQWPIFKIHLQRKIEIKSWEGGVAFLSHFKNREDVLSHWNLSYKILIQNEVHSFFHFAPNIPFRLEYNPYNRQNDPKLFKWYRWSYSVCCFLGWNGRELTIFPTFFQSKTKALKIDPFYRCSEFKKYFLCGAFWKININYRAFIDTFHISVSNRTLKQSAFG